MRLAVLLGVILVCTSCSIPTPTVSSLSPPPGKAILVISISYNYRDREQFQQMFARLLPSAGEFTDDTVTFSMDSAPIATRLRAPNFGSTNLHYALAMRPGYWVPTLNTYLERYTYDTGPGEEEPAPRIDIIGNCLNETVPVIELVEGEISVVNYDMFLGPDSNTLNLIGIGQTRQTRTMKSLEFIRAVMDEQGVTARAKLAQTAGYASFDARKNLLQAWVCPSSTTFTYEDAFAPSISVGRPD